MTFDCKARVGEDGRKLNSQIAIGEVDDTQAARSYTMACSISSLLSP
jgi:hypothetical protein